MCKLIVSLPSLHIFQYSTIGFEGTIERRLCKGKEARKLEMRVGEIIVGPGNAEIKK